MIPETRPSWWSSNSELLGPTGFCLQLCPEVCQDVHHLCQDLVVHDGQGDVALVQGFEGGASAAMPTTGQENTVGAGNVLVGAEGEATVMLESRR